MKVSLLRVDLLTLFSHYEIFKCWNKTCLFEWTLDGHYGMVGKSSKLCLYVQGVLTSSAPLNAYGFSLCDSNLTLILIFTGTEMIKMRREGVESFHSRSSACVFLSFHYKIWGFLHFEKKSRRKRNLFTLN